MSNIAFVPYLLVMAGVTYLIRMLPLILIKKKIQSRFLLSFLHYIPYSVLSVMTIPAIFSSTSYTYSATIGLVVALILSYKEKTLLTVAAFSCLAVFVTELIIKYI